MTHSETNDKLKIVEVGKAARFWCGWADERLQHVLLNWLQETCAERQKTWKSTALHWNKEKIDRRQNLMLTSLKNRVNGLGLHAVIQLAVIQEKS